MKWIGQPIDTALSPSLPPFRPASIPLSLSLSLSPSLSRFLSLSIRWPDLLRSDVEWQKVLHVEDQRERALLALPRGPPSDLHLLAALGIAFKEFRVQGLGFKV